MAKSEVDILTDEKIAKGGVLARLYFDMQDTNKDKLQPLLVELVNEHLLKEKGVVYCYGAIEEPIERKGMYITSATVTMLFESFFPLVSIAFGYSPAGIEMLRPQKEMTFRVNELQTLLLDLSQVALNYSKYILDRVLKPEDLEKINSEISNRLELGKKLLENKKDEEEK